MLIEQHMGLVKPPPPLSAAARSVSEHGRPTPTPPQRSTTETSLYLSHKPFQDLIKALSEENKYFVCRNRHPKQENCCPILESGYIMIKDDKGVANKLNRIPTGHKRASTVKKNLRNKRERGGVLNVIQDTPTKYIHWADVIRLVGVLRKERLIRGGWRLHRRR